jgi:hypothetical protein
MADANALWSSIDFTRTKEVLDKLSATCECDCCQTFPSPTSAGSFLVYHVDGCDHDLCEVCYPLASKSCPVPKCGIKTTIKTVKKNEGLASR